MKIQIPVEARLYYEQGKSLCDISKIIGIPVSTTRAGLISTGVKMRTRAEGMKLSGWKTTANLKGKKRKPFSRETCRKISEARLKHSSEHAKGFRVRRNGYVVFTKGPNVGRSVHDIIIEALVGRRLLKSEIVHHKDRNRGNNDPFNLQLMTRKNHTKLHRQEGW